MLYSASTQRLMKKIKHTNAYLLNNKRMNILGALNIHQRDNAHFV